MARKKQKLRNPNFAVSLNRLSVRNVPLQLTDKELRQLCYNTTKVECKKLGKKVGNITLKQARIERDSSKFDRDGLPKSRGFGFVQFVDPDHALICLRALNNNPTIWGQQKRPIVEFALEDARKLLIHRKRKEKNVGKSEKTGTAKKTAEQEAMAMMMGGGNNNNNKADRSKQVQDIFKNKGAGEDQGNGQKRGRPQNNQQDKSNKKQRT